MFRRIKNRDKRTDSILMAHLQKPSVPEIPIDHDLTVKLGNAQHQGKRDYQEDSFGFSDTDDEFVMQKGMLAVLADGMGGLSNGKAVSGRVVSDMLEWFNQRSEECRDGNDIKDRVLIINKNICSIFCDDGTVKSGSTIVTAFIKHRKLHWLCIGDSRIYLKRGGRIYQINEDHDFLNQLLGEAIRDGESVASAFEDPQKDRLVSCIGKSDLNCFDYSKKGFSIQANDKIMLCSDGVYNALTAEELNVLLESEPMRAAENIKNEVVGKSFPGQDNLTVIVIAIDDKGEEQ
ncbi:MAG: serine/threonine-protein phosphatase [Oscillospiraceae bacterium]|nr:serine/threonine-protein phosphatase [Oscillospiraceae bacterium]